MKKNRIKNFICCLLTVCMTVLTFMTCGVNVEAAEVLTGPMVVVENYQVSNGKIIPGEDFTLTLTLKNYNMHEEADEVLLDISNPDGVAPVYGTVSQVYVGDIGPGESKEISIDYNSWTTITDVTLDFYVTIVTSVNQNYIVLRIPSGSDSPFSILSSNVPAEVGLNELANFSLTFKVLGEENVGNVAMTLSYNGEVINSSQIGVVTPGATKTQQMSMYFAAEGEYALDLGLEYMDDAGQKQTDTVLSTVLKVVDNNSGAGNSNYPGPMQEPAENGANNLLLLGVSGILILAIFLVVIIIMRKNK